MYPQSVPSPSRPPSDSWVVTSDPGLGDGPGDAIALEQEQEQGEIEGPFLLKKKKGEFEVKHGGGFGVPFVIRQLRAYELATG